MRSSGTKNQRKARLEFGAAVNIARFQDLVSSNGFSAPSPIPLAEPSAVAGSVRENDGFPELTRHHKGLRAGAGLKCTFCSVAPQTQYTQKSLIRSQALRESSYAGA